MLQIPATIDAEMLEVVRPKYFKPNPKSKHKPGKKGTEGKKRKRTSEEPATLPNLVAQLEAAKGLMEKLPESSVAYVHLGQSRNRRQVRPVPSTKANPNPPMITFQQGLVSRCQGCPTKITKQDPPMDMVFRLKAVRPFMNKKTGLWQDAIGNAYFHLDVTCVTAAGCGPVIPGYTFVLAGVKSGLCTHRVVTVTRSVMVMNTISILWAGTH